MNDPIFIAPVDSNPPGYVLSILQDAVVIVNRNYCITYINQSAEQALYNHAGYQPKIGEDYIDYVEEYRREKTRALIDEAFDNRASVIEVSYSQEGADCWFELGYYPIPNENGTVNHACVRAKNITDKVLLEKNWKSKDAIKRIL